MKTRNYKSLFLKKALPALAAMIIFTGCRAPQNITYFQDAANDQVINLAAVNPIKVGPGDKLVIIVKTKDAAMSSLFNLPVYGEGVEETPTTLNNSGAIAHSNLGSRGLAEYTVGPDGDIDFPTLGKLHIGGMTRQEIAGFIKGELMGRNLLKDPTVTVEFRSAAVNVLGHVSRPGRIEFNRDQMTIFDALSLSGDILLTGQHDNVKVLRKEGDVMKSYVLDLTDAKSVLKSPAYYLQQGDVVYVEPNDMQKRSTISDGNSFMTMGFWISVASLLTTVATTIGVFVK